MFNLLSKNTEFILNNDKLSFADLLIKIGPLVDWLKNNSVKNLLVNNDRFIEIFFAGVLAQKEIYLLSGATKTIPDDIDVLELCPAEIDNIYKNEGAKNSTPCQIDSDKIYLNFCTSGSTSTPKIIRKTLTNMIVEAKEILEEHTIDKNLTFYTTTKFPHLFGATFALFVPLVNGNKINTEQIKYPEQIDDENFVFVSTPSFLSRIVKYDNPTKYNPKMIVTAGDKLDENVYKYYADKSKILEIYGSTETGVIAYKNKYTDNLKLFKNVNLKPIDEDKFEIKSNIFDEDFLIINDSIKIHADRTLEFLNRSDRILKINEKRINAIEIENIINRNKLIDTSYCLKIDNKLAAVLVLTADAELSKTEQIIKDIKNDLKSLTNLTLAKFRFLPEIPRTETGKIDKIKLKRIFEISPTLPVISSIKRDKNYVELKVKFSKTSNYFRGHFPGYPILPGVVQVFFAHFLAQFYFDMDLDFSKLKKIKFSKLIHPEIEIVIKLYNTETSLTFEYLKEQKCLSSGSFIKNGGHY